MFAEFQLADSLMGETLLSVHDAARLNITLAIVEELQELVLDNTDASQKHLLAIAAKELRDVLRSHTLS